MGARPLMARKTVTPVGPAGRATAPRRDPAPGLALASDDATPGRAAHLAVDLAPRRPTGLGLEHPVIVAAGGAGFGGELLESVGDLTPGADRHRGSHPTGPAGQRGAAHGPRVGCAPEHRRPPGSRARRGHPPPRTSLGEQPRADHRERPCRQRRGHRLARPPARHAAGRRGRGARSLRPGPRARGMAHRPRRRGQRACHCRGTEHDRPAPHREAHPGGARHPGDRPGRRRRRCRRHQRHRPVARAGTRRRSGTRRCWAGRTEGCPVLPSSPSRCAPSTRSPRSCASPSSASAA